MDAYPTIFDSMTATESLFEAWFTFRRGKCSRVDVRNFSRHAERELFALRRRLLSGSYRHGSYQTFYIQDPKPRAIRKANVVDRVVHQALHTELTKLYDRRLLEHVYSGRIGKGVHAGVRAVERMTWKESKNYSRPCFYLKCDIRRFYDSVDHGILLGIIRRTIKDERMIAVIERVVSSFHTEGAPGKGLPIGNLTSQIFTNIYLDTFDRFMADRIGGSRYARFADDFVVMSHRPLTLMSLREEAEDFLAERLKLALHPHKVTLAPLHRGLDFLGYVLLPHYRRVRSTTVRRMFRKLSLKLGEHYAGHVSVDHVQRSLSSYLGVLSHADTYGLSSTLRAHSFIAGERID
jgi:RNA-directed DNA polymerase